MPWRAETPQTPLTREPPDTERLQTRLHAILTDLARKRVCVTYRDLAALAAVPPPHSIHKLTLALEDLIREDAAAGRPLLAALAVSRGPAALPGRGFFALLRELGRYQGPDSGAEAAAYHGAEVERAWNHWGNGSS